LMMVKYNSYGSVMAGCISKYNYINVNSADE
jgi:hypothetical protein